MTTATVAAPAPPAPVAAEPAGRVVRPFWQYLLLRLGRVVALLVIITALVSAMTLLIPGNPAKALAGPGATAQRVAAIRAQLGLNRSWIDQYWTWLWHALHGNLGNSVYNGQPVTTTLGQRLPITLSLTGLALLFALVVGIPAGVISGLRTGRPVDLVGRGLSTLGLALPSYWLGILLVIVFSVAWHVLPSEGYTGFSHPAGWLRHMILPIVSLGTVGAAEVCQQTRASVASVMQQEFVLTARAKGLPERVLVPKHAMRLALGPVLVVIGLLVPILFGGAIVVEQVFSLPGLGSQAVTSVVDRDVPVVQGIVVVGTILVVGSALIVDLLGYWLDPRAGRGTI